MQKALSCANVNDKLANPLKLMAYTVQVSLVEFTCKFVCKMFKHFAGHDIPLISTHIFILVARYLYYIADIYTESKHTYLPLYHISPKLSPRLSTSLYREQKMNLYGS